MASEQVVRLLNKLAQIAELEPDWDDEGSKVVPDELILSAAAYLNPASKCWRGLPKYVSPSPDGTVTFEWFKDGVHTVAEIEEPNVAGVTTRHADGTFTHSTERWGTGWVSEVRQPTVKAGEKGRE